MDRCCLMGKRLQPLRISHSAGIAAPAARLPPKVWCGAQDKPSAPRALCISLKAGRCDWLVRFNSAGRRADLLSRCLLKAQEAAVDAHAAISQ